MGSIVGTSSGPENNKRSPSRTRVPLDCNDRREISELHVLVQVALTIRLYGDNVVGIGGVKIAIVSGLEQRRELWDWLGEICDWWCGIVD